MKAIFLLIPPHSALRAPAYRLWMLVQTLSLVGGWAQLIAESWLAYRITGSTVVLGSIVFAAQLPSLFLSSFGGVLADRLDTRRILVVTQTAFLLQALGMAAFFFFDRKEVWMLIGLALFSGVANAFDAPARQALVVRMLDQRDQLASAVSLNSVGFNIARFIGPAVAGVLVVHFREGICFLINAASFVPLILTVSMFRLCARDASTKPGGFREGLTYTLNHPTLCLLIGLVGAAALFVFPYYAILPAFTKEILGGDAEVVGFLTSTAAIGALAANLFLALTRSMFSKPATLALGYGVSTIAVLLLSVISHIWLAAIDMFFLVGAAVCAMVSANTLIQTEVEDAYRGKVSGLYFMVMVGLGPFGAMWSGTLAKWIGIPQTFLLNGLCMLAALLAFGWRARRSSRNSFGAAKSASGTA